MLIKENGTSNSTDLKGICKDPIPILDLKKKCIAKTWEGMYVLSQHSAFISSLRGGTILAFSLKWGTRVAITHYVTNHTSPENGLEGTKQSNRSDSNEKLYNFQNAGCKLKV